MGKRFPVLLVMAICFSLITINANAREFLVGGEYPLSGKLASTGQAFLKGAQTAVAVFNQQHPEHTVKLLDIDNETSPAKAVTAVEKLVSQGVLAFTGGFSTAIISPASDAAHKAGKIYMTSGSLSKQMAHRGHKGFFRINNAGGYIKAMVGLFKSKNIKSVSLLHVNADATTKIGGAVASILKKQGVKVTVHPFDKNMTDFKPVINKIRLRDKSEAIAMVCYVPDYMNILRAAKVIKPPTVKMVAGLWSLATAKNREKFADLIPNVMGTAILAWPAEFVSPEAKAFAAAYEKLHGEVPDYQGQFGFVQSMLLFEAILRSHEKGTLDKEGALAEELRLTDRETLLGRVTFDEFGENKNFTMYVGQHQKDGIPIVWPAKQATGKQIYPGLPW
jgi:branched-chain amino acid transport system substrate-binding protein